MKNFRELGGLVTKDGRTVKAGKLYRSSALNVKDNVDMAFIDAVRPDCIIDFRCAEEKRGKADYVPANCDYIFAPVFAQKNNPYIAVTLTAKIRTLCLCGKRIQKLYDDKTNSYKNFPYSVAYSQLFSRMDRGDTIIFHCTAGKDRTGFAAALILSILGCDTKTIYNDYLLSNIISPGEDRSMLKKLGLSENHIKAIKYCESVHTELLDESFKEIHKYNGDVLSYLFATYGVTLNRINKWKEFYLN